MHDHTSDSVQLYSATVIYTYTYVRKYNLKHYLESSITYVHAYAICMQLQGRIQGARGAGAPPFKIFLYMLFLPYTT